VKITLDSTMLVRAFDNTGGLARHLPITILDGNHILVLSSEILSETSRVLRYPRMRARHGMSESRIYEYVMFLQTAAMNSPGVWRERAALDGVGKGSREMRHNKIQ
jgi:predicted nucleic acid-binding protein